MPKITQSLFVVPFADQINKPLNGFVETASGTTSASVTVKASEYTSNNNHPSGAALALTDLLVGGTGDPTITVQSGARTLFTFKTGGGFVKLDFTTFPMTERGADLVVSVAGATAGASVTALGFPV